MGDICLPPQGGSKGAREAFPHWQVGISGRAPVWGVRHEYANLPAFPARTDVVSLIQQPAVVRTRCAWQSEQFRHGCRNRQLVTVRIGGQFRMSLSLQLHHLRRMSGAILLLPKQREQSLA